VGFFWKKGAKTPFLEKRAPRAQKTQKALYEKGVFWLFFLYVIYNMTSSVWMNKTFDKIVEYLDKESVRLSLETKFIDPILNHIMNRIFPYILLLCIMFIVLIFSVFIILAILVMRGTTAHIVSYSKADE